MKRKTPRRLARSFCVCSGAYPASVPHPKRFLSRSNNFSVTESLRVRYRVQASYIGRQKARGSMKIRVSKLLTIIALGGFAAAVCAAPPKNRLPFTMVGGASPTQRATAGDTIIYTLTAAPTSIAHVAAPTSREALAFFARPLALRSMKGPTVSVGLRGIGKDDERTWDVCGQAAAQPGIYHDTWQVYDNLPAADPRKNVPLQYVQTAIVTAPGAAGVSPFASFAPRFVPPPIRPEEKSERERLSDRLRPKLFQRLTPAQKAALKAGEEVSVAVFALPANLQDQAEEYIRACTDGRPMADRWDLTQKRRRGQNNSASFSCRRPPSRSELTPMTANGFRPPISDAPAIQIRLLDAITLPNVTARRFRTRSFCFPGRC